MLFAAASVKEESGTVIFVGAVDEEGNATGIKNLVKNRPDVDYAIFGEPSGTKQITIAYKGRIAINLKINVQDSAHASAPWLAKNAIEETGIFVNEIKRILESDQEEKKKGMKRENKISTGLPKPISLDEFQSIKEGGFFTGTGLAMLHGTPSQPEFVLDNQAAAVFLKAATLLSGSQVMAQNGMGNGSPVIINNVDNSQRNPVVSNQATQIKVPDNPRPSDPTMLAVQGSQMFN